MSSSSAAVKNVVTSDPVFECASGLGERSRDDRIAEAFAEVFPQILALYDPDPEVAMEKAMVSALNRTVARAKQVAKRAP
jgi:hypothetical protein